MLLKLLIIFQLLFQSIRLVPVNNNHLIAIMDDDGNVRGGSDLSYLGSAIFGEPNEKVSENLQGWNENSNENPEELGEYAEGDILFPSTGRNGLIAETSRWPKGEVPYEISGYYSTGERELIQRAIGIYHKYTCIRFRPRTRDDNDYLSITNGNSGCWSSVGRLKGRQEVNLQSPYCTTKVGTVLHELMHAIGFLHEQNRWERDDYVKIVWGNIKSGHDANFKKADKDSTFGFGVAYDYRSVMHYSPTAFSINGQPTIMPIDPAKKEKMGQREGFSRGDILKLNSMYKCSNKDPAMNDTNGNIVASNAEDKNKEQNGGNLLSLLFNIFQ